MDKDTIKQLAEHDVEITDLQKDVDKLKADSLERDRKAVIREWLYTKCIWVWTLLLGWCFMAGAFLVDHYDKVALVVIAAINALKNSNK